MDISNIENNQPDRDGSSDNSFSPKTGKSQTSLPLNEISGIIASITLVIGILIWYLVSNSLNQKTVPLFVEVGTLYQTSGKTQDAVRVLDQASDIGTKDPVLLGRMGETYRLLRQYDKSIYVLKKALKIEPDNTSFRLSIARSLGSRGRCEQAIPEYLHLIASDVENIGYGLGLVGCYRALEEYDLAFAELNRLQDLDPTNIQIYLTRGDIYRQQDSITDAIDQYFKALEINSKLYSTRMTLGQMFSDQRNFDIARIQYEEAITIDPERSEPYYLMAETYIGQGNFLQAITFYNKVLEIDKQHTPSILGMGKSYAAMGVCQTAASYFEQILRFNSENEDAIQGLENCSIMP